MKSRKINWEKILDVIILRLLSVILSYFDYSKKLMLMINALLAGFFLFYWFNYSEQ